jgi:hypothetical protein
MNSLAFRALSFPARRALDFIIREHLRHGGSENGRLVAPHRQLETDACISKRDTANALRELEQFGLVECVERGFRLGGRDTPSRYRLTFLPTQDGRLPTNDWRRFKQADFQEYQRERALRRENKLARTQALKNPTLERI